MEVLGIKLTEIKVCVFGQWQKILVADTAQFQRALRDLDQETDDYLRDYEIYKRSWNQ